jgi:hypothetical protein
MLTAVWVAVVAFVIGVGVAVYVMLKAARLMTDSSATLASLREREDLLLDRAGAAIDRAGEQITRTETITASMDGVTVSMAEVTASLAELGGRVAALTPAAPARPDGISGTLTWTAALVYGLTRAIRLRWAARWHRGPGARESAAGPARPTLPNGPRPTLPDGSRPTPVGGPPPRAALTGRRRAAATGRGGKVAP